MPNVSELPQLIKVPVIRDPRGALGILESPVVPFQINRVYFLFDLQSESMRGAHAHKSLKQLLLPLSGSFSVTLSDSPGYHQVFDLNSPANGLLLPPGFWRELGNFSAGAVCLVLASDTFDDSDYIRDYGKFSAWKASI